MSVPRFAARSLHASAVTHIRAALTTLGWLDAATVPFGGPPARLETTPAFVGDRLRADLEPTTVVITLGDELAPDPRELGGPLHRQAYPLFYDTFCATEAETLALACDIRDVLLGRVSGHPTATMVDQATGTPVADWLIEIDDVERVAPPHTFPLPWQAVHATFTAYYPEVAYG